MKAPVFEDVLIGQEIPVVVKGPMTTAHVMRWSASMENWHRIHYDRLHALDAEFLSSSVSAILTASSAVRATVPAGLRTTL